MSIRKLCKDILTGADNRSYDNGRILCVTSFLSYYVLAFVNAGLGHFWSAIDFSSGCTAMAIGFGINLKLKRSTEPRKELRE